MWYVIIGILVLLIDQVTKAFAASASGVVPGSLGTGKVKIAEVIKGFLEIEYCENNNGMMGIFSFLNNGRLVFIVTTIIILVGMIIFVIFTKNRGKWLNTALALIFSGAIGNFLDRIFNDGGYVRDMIHVIIKINGKEVFPYIFNVADIALVVGTIMLVVFMLFISDEALFMTKARREKIEKANEVRSELAKELTGEEVTEEAQIDANERV